MMLLKKIVYDKLVTHVNAISKSEFVLKIQYNVDKSRYQKKIDDMSKKMSDTSGFVKKTDYNTSIADIEHKTPSTIGLATTAALNDVGNTRHQQSSQKKKKIMIRKIIWFRQQDWNTYCKIRIKSGAR